MSKTPHAQAAVSGRLYNEAAASHRVYNDADQHRRITASEVRRLCGDVSDMWIWRRLNEGESGFPQPAYIGRRRFWREADVIEWLDAQATVAA